MCEWFICILCVIECLEIWCSRKAVCSNCFIVIMCVHAINIMCDCKQYVRMSGVTVIMCVFKCMCDFVLKALCKDAPGHQPGWTWRFGDSDFMRWYFTAQVLQIKSPLSFLSPGLAVFIH